MMVYRKLSRFARALANGRHPTEQYFGNFSNPDRDLFQVCFTYPYPETNANPEKFDCSLVLVKSSHFTKST